MKIVEYIDYDNIVVEFKDEKAAKVHTGYNAFLSGGVKNPYYPSVYKFGIVGTKYPTIKNDKCIKEYTTWRAMLRRCFDDSYKNARATYANATCCNEWLNYEYFYEWLHKQENFKQWLNNEKWSIDKDILVKRNKIYSPYTCCLVPCYINSLFAKCDALRGDLPIGIQKHGQKYRGHLKILGNHTNLPARDSINEAFLDYKIEKEYLIKQVAQEEYSKGNITKQCYEAMMNYEVEIDD